MATTDLGATVRVGSLPGRQRRGLPWLVTVRRADYDPGAPWVSVRLGEIYEPANAAGYAVRPGLFNAREVASFPKPEADALIALGAADHL